MTSTLFSCSNEEYLRSEYNVYYSLCEMSLSSGWGFDIGIACWIDNSEWFTCMFSIGCSNPSPSIVERYQNHYPCPIWAMRTILKSGDFSTIVGFIISVPPTYAELKINYDHNEEYFETLKYVQDQLHTSFTNLEYYYRDKN